MDPHRPAGNFVDVNQRALQEHSVLSHIEPLRLIRQEPLNDRLDLASNHAFVRTRETNLIYQLQRAPTLDGQWTTNAVQTAPGSGLVEFHDTSPLPDRAFYRTFQD